MIESAICAVFFSWAAAQPKYEDFAKSSLHKIVEDADDIYALDRSVTALFDYFRERPAEYRVFLSRAAAPCVEMVK